MGGEEEFHSMKREHTDVYIYTIHTRYTRRLLRLEEAALGGQCTLWVAHAALHTPRLWLLNTVEHCKELWVDSVHRLHKHWEDLQTERETETERERE